MAARVLVLSLVALAVFLACRMLFSVEPIEYPYLGNNGARLRSTSAKLENSHEKNAPVVETKLNVSLPAVEDSEVRIAAAEKYDRFPQDYVEIFPGLETYSWLFNRTETAGVRKIMATLQSVSYDFQMTKLINIERGGFVNALDEKFHQNLQSIVGNGSANKYFFSGGRQIGTIEATPSGLPVCIIEIDKIRLKKALDLRNGQSLKQLGFVSGVRFPTSEYLGFRGVRISFANRFNGGQVQWLRSIECLARVLSGDKEKFKALEVIHMSASIGTFYYYHGAQRTINALGERSFEELMADNPEVDR